MTESCEMETLWQPLLEQALAPQRVWRDMLGQNFDRLSAFLAPTGGIADFVPCANTPVNGCGLRISHAADGLLAGICAENECPKTSFSRAELAILKIDWSALLVSLGKALALTGTPGQVASLPAATQVGWIAPAQTARFPVFFCAPTEFHPVFPEIQRFAERSAGGPFVVIVPSRASLDTDSCAVLKSRDAALLVLEEDIAIDPNGRLLASEAATRLIEFALAAGGVRSEPGLPKFPTPEGAQWTDLKISEVNGHTIEIHAVVRARGRVLEARESYSFEKLHLAKRSGKDVAPMDCWTEFLMPIIRKRRVAASNIAGWSGLKKHKQQVAALLSDLTGLDAKDAFTSHAGRSCYEAAFRVDCAAHEETPIPDAPRRLNQKGAVARGRSDE